MTVEEFFDKVITVRMKEDRSALDIIDQTLLPGTIKRIRISTKEEIWEAIKKLKVRGAPAIGAAAAYGIALLSSRITADRYETFYPEFKELKDYLASSRPMFFSLEPRVLSILDTSLARLPMSVNVIIISSPSYG